MSCLAHQENTLCPREEKEGKRPLPTANREGLLCPGPNNQTSWPDPFGSVTTCWQSGENSFWPSQGWVGKPLGLKAGMRVSSV